ncbi:hypothetical protein [Bacterioplanoides sp.]|uniref:hypothetical protein n=1 Tax=Bacterioplanoides sp. TaxID=2066072 RepID=UPI003B006ABF
MTHSNSRHPDTGGQQLYQLLPEVYRSRDQAVGHAGGEGDFKQYLEAFGDLFDAFRQLLDQRLADSFPDNPENPNELACQEWVLPYFAQLVNARLLSPDGAGRRDEVTNAVSWRQRKGTLVVAEQISESVGGYEAELHEGWQRVATTPRIGAPITSALLLGYDESDYPEQALSNAGLYRYPLMVARHPGLTAATLDTRWQARAVRSGRDNPAAKTSGFAGQQISWRPVNSKGAPAHPNGFDDPSRRVLDLRDPSWQHGHYHPRRLLVHVPSQHGLLPLPVKTLTATDDLLDFLQFRAQQAEGEVVLSIEPVSNHPLTIDRPLQLPADLEPVLISLGIAGAVSRYQIGHIYFAQGLQVNIGRLDLSHSKVTHLDVNTAGNNEVVASVSDCLLASAQINGVLDCRRTTVLADLQCDGLQASDCIFNGAITNFLNELPAIQASYSALAVDIIAGLNSAQSDDPLLNTLIPDQAVFIASTLNGKGDGLLAPDCPPVFFTAASDGAELGYYHSLKRHPELIDGDLQLTIPAGFSHIYRQLVIIGTLTVTVNSKGPLILEQVAVRRLEVKTPRQSGAEFAADSVPEPVLMAKSCLFEQLAVDHGLARLEYCTIIHAYKNQAEADDTYLRLQASDCVFASEEFGPLSAHDCIRYSRIPAALKALENQFPQLRFPHCTDDLPFFFVDTFAEALAAGRTGEIGCGVLHPSSPDSICFGAEDGGEMGAHHDWFFCLKRRAVITKLADHLPMGIVPVLITDPALNQPPLPLCDLTQ